MMQSEKLKLARIHAQLEALKLDHQSVMKALAVELNPTDINRLNKRLENIEAEVGQLELEQKELQDFLKQSLVLSPWQKLEKICHQYVAQFPEMRTAYQDVLQTRSWRYQVEPKSLETLMTQICQIPQGQSIELPMDEFAAYLVKRSMNNSLINEIQHWGKEERQQTWEITLQYVEDQLEKIREQQTQQANPVLLMYLERRDEVSTQSGDERHYHIDAWLIADSQIYRKSKQGIIPLDGADPTEDKTYAFSQLSEDFPKILCDYLTEIERKIDKPPIIHIFLPFELMNQAIDRWQFDDGESRVRPLGHKYLVLLRCTDRVSRSYRQVKLWQQQWQKYHAHCGLNAAQTFVPGNDNDLDDLLYDIEDAMSDSDTIIGLKVTQPPTCDGDESLFSILMEVGMPVAIWGRQELNTTTNEDALDRVLAGCCLENLPITVQKERRQSRRHPKNAHIGHHLALLWDDPSLVPPKSA